MSQTPSLEQYPGYFPAAKPPFWNRTKAAVAAGVGGLVIGLIAASGGTANTEEPSTSQAVDVAPVVEPADVDLDQAVDQAVSDEHARMEDKLAQQRASAQDRLANARARAANAQRRAVRQAVTHTRSVERAKAARAVRAARAQAQAPVPVTSSGGTDPMFDYCYEANDAGYGPYFQGQDPEYDWYDDADHDGEVCE